MTRQSYGHPLPFRIGIAASVCILAGLGQVVADDDFEYAMIPQADEQAVLVEEFDGTSGVADLERPIEIIQERYAGGELKIRREVAQDTQDNYILHGQWKMWDEEGNLIGSGEYRNNERQGKWSRIHTGKDAPLFAELPYTEFTAPFTSEANFESGRLEGTWVIKDSEGRIASEWEFADGNREGVSRWNYASGKLMREAVYHAGLLDGYVRVYDADSTLIDEQKFEQGHKIAMKVELDKAGKKVWEAMYMHAQLVVDAEVDWWNASPATFRTEGEDVKHGLATGWHPNGQMRVQGVYDRDRPNGQFTWWYPNGQEEVTGGFKQGLKDGLWVWRHANGQKSMMGQSKDGAAVGVWFKWQEDGQLVEKTDFSAITEEEQEPTLAAEPDALNDATLETSQNPLKDLFSR